MERKIFIYDLGEERYKKIDDIKIDVEGNIVIDISD